MTTRRGVAQSTASSIWPTRPPVSERCVNGMLARRGAQNGLSATSRCPMYASRPLGCTFDVTSTYPVRLSAPCPCAETARTKTSRIPPLSPVAHVTVRSTIRDGVACVPAPLPRAGKSAPKTNVPRARATRARDIRITEYVGSSFPLSTGHAAAPPERTKTALTVDGHHFRPPCAVGTPSAVSARAISERP